MRNLTEQWVAVGNRELWRHEQWATYITLDFERLPELPMMDEALHWLANVNIRFDEDGEPINLALEDKALFSSILAEAVFLQLELPQSFIRFMQQPELQKRVPSCTDCFLELSDQFISLKQPNTYALRFMNDQQSCVMWYLYFEGGKCVGVIASAYFLEPDLFQAMYGEEYDLNYDEIQNEIILCAKNFTSFLHRFWFENELWFAMNNDEELTSEQQNYIKEAHGKSTKKKAM